jgi:hypothetical protein
MKSLLVAVLLTSLVMPVFADYKITQETRMDEVTMQFTVYAKGVRERRESKMIMDGVSPEDLAMMGNMMPPSITEITQCDLKQNVSLNEKAKSYFIDYYDWSGLSPEQKKRLPAQKVVIKGTSTVTDSGKRKQMFGLTARWLKAVQSIESSADSCDGKASARIEREGWFVDLALTADSCPVPPIPETKGGCRPRIIMGTMQDPGFFLEGTSKMYENGKLQGTTNIKTTALSKATLDQALFEIPKSYTEVDSMSELMGINRPNDTSAKTVFTDAPKAGTVKTVAIDFFSGNASKLDQDKLRNHISQKLTDAGMSGRVISSQAEISGGSFVNIIGVELKKVKESGASKIGGLFGKVTNTDAGKIGNTQAEIVVTIYAKDGKTVVASAPASVDVKGTGDDAVKAAIDQVIGGLLAKIK